MFNLFRKKETPAPIPEKKKQSDFSKWGNNGTVEQIKPIIGKHKPYEPPKGVVPDGVAVGDSCDYTHLNSCYEPDTAFMGFPALAQLAQKSEYLIATSESANEAVRNGFVIKTTDASIDRTKEIKQLENAFRALKIKDVMRTLGVKAEIFGGAHLSVMFDGENAKDREKGILLSGVSNKKGKLKGFKVIEPIWCYPAIYDAADPYSEWFYRPSQWYVLGNKVDSSRITQLIPYPVPDMLKPSYNFMGRSLIQMMIPYVQNWEKVRDDIPEIIKSLRLMVFKTDAEAKLTDPNIFSKRMKAFTEGRSNYDVAAIDKDAEDIAQISTPLSELNNLLETHLKLLCVPSRLSQTKMTGVQPSGMSATGEGERESMHETIAGKQEAAYSKVLDWILQLVMLNEFGEVYDDITAEFSPLDEMSEQDIAATRLANSTADANLINAGVVSPEQAAEKLAKDPISGYTGITFEGGINEIDYEENQDTEDSSVSPTAAD